MTNLVLVIFVRSSSKLQNLVTNNTMNSELSEQVPEHMQYLYTTTVQNE